MSAAMPYVKWHGRDWLGDPMLRMVGPEVRGVWIDLLCAMMNADPYGHLAVNGRPMTDDQAARMCGLDKGTFKGILDQIEQANISSRTACGMLYSRRLVRDHEAFLRSSNAGRKGGGNPNVRSQKPEAIVQKPEARDPLKGPFKGQEGHEGQVNKRSTPVQHPLPSTPKDPRPRNPLMDAMGAVEAPDVSELNRAAWKRVGVALAEVKEVAPDVTPDEIARRAVNYRTHFDGAALTAQALAKHWAKCKDGKVATQGGQSALRSWMPSGTGGL